MAVPLQDPGFENERWQPFAERSARTRPSRARKVPCISKRNHLSLKPAETASFRSNRKRPSPFRARPELMRVSKEHRAELGRRRLSGAHGGSMVARLLSSPEARLG